MWTLLGSHDFQELTMQSTTTIGIDIAKSVLQVHGVDAAGEMVIRRQLKRRYVLAFFEKLPPCLVGIEACAFVSLLVANDAGASVWRRATKTFVNPKRGLRHPKVRYFPNIRAAAHDPVNLFHPSTRSKQFSPRTKSFRH